MPAEDDPPFLLQFHSFDHTEDANAVPKWHGDDFDSIYVVTITWRGEPAKASFAHKQEGLDGQSDTCPH
jgi:hypothetical protein